MISTFLIAGLVGVTQASADTLSPNPDLRCGAYCLYVGMRALELPVGEFKELEWKLGQPTRMGYSMQQLAEAASSFGAHTLGVKTSLEQLERRPGRFACIALLDKSGHYINIYDIDESIVYIIDPPNRRSMARDAFARLWTGKALLISNDPLDASVPRSYPALSVLAALAGATVVAILFFVTVRLRSR